MDKDDNTIVLGSGTYSIDQNTYTFDSISGGTDTITIDPSIYTNIGSGISANWSQNYTITSSNYDSNVNISSDGVSMKDDCDIKIGDRSLKDFMNHVEDQLAILRPAPELEEKWDKLKELRRQYEECKQDILEKEKLMKILKE
jgi:hypothetical protein